MTMMWIFIGVVLTGAILFVTFYNFGRNGGRRESKALKKKDIPESKSEATESLSGKPLNSGNKEPSSGIEVSPSHAPVVNPVNSSSLKEPASDAEQPEGKAEVRPIYFGNLKLQGPQATFFNDNIVPHIEDFRRQKAIPLLKAVMGLLESHGDCPSVVEGSKDQEAKDLYTVKSTLKKVTLKQHSYAVAIYSVALIIENHYNRGEYLIPQAIITALAHDIGKIPEFRESGLYHVGREHTATSVAKFRELARGMKIYWFEDAVKAIRDHHIASSDKFTQLLKQADARARETELTYFSKEYSIKPFKEWFNAEMFLRLIESDTNYLKKGRWKAVSYQGVVYCFPEYLYQTGRKLCRNSKALDLAFMPESERGHAIKMIIDELRKHGFVSDMLPEDRCAWRFKVISKAGNKFFMLTPLVWEGFNLGLIEKRKFGYIDTVMVVRCPGNTK